MPDYARLKQFLENTPSDITSLSVFFTKLESVLKGPLPASARKHRPWWSNTQSHSHALRWLEVGWKVAEVDMANEVVTFARANKAHREDPADRHGDRDQGGGNVSNSSVTPAGFETLACEAVEKLFSKKFQKDHVQGVPKKFDLVSEDHTAVGDAKYYTMVRGQSLPPAKFSVIAEHVWLLEKTKAAKRFLIFGNDRRVPTEWLRRYGHLLYGVDFYFLDTNSRKLERLS